VLPDSSGVFFARGNAFWKIVVDWASVAGEPILWCPFSQPARGGHSEGIQSCSQGLAHELYGEQRAEFKASAATERERGALARFPIDVGDR